MERCVNEIRVLSIPETRTERKLIIPRKPSIVWMRRRVFMICILSVKSHAIAWHDGLYRDGCCYYDFIVLSKKNVLRKQQYYDFETRKILRAEAYEYACAPLSKLRHTSNDVKEILRCTCCCACGYCYWTLTAGTRLSSIGQHGTHVINARGLCSGIV
jgi:hypothetical protein